MFLAFFTFVAYLRLEARRASEKRIAKFVSYADRLTDDIKPSKYLTYLDQLRKIHGLTDRELAKATFSAEHHGKVTLARFNSSLPRTPE